MEKVFGKDFAENFLIDSFANEEDEWMTYAEFFGLNFLKEFNENFTFMKNKIDSFGHRIKNLSDVESDQARLFMNFFSLRMCISINKERTNALINIKKIRENFIKVTQPDELEGLKLAITKSNAEIQNTTKIKNLVQESGPFDKMNFFFTLTISFIKEVDVRKEYYANHLLNKPVTDDEFDVDKLQEVYPLSDYNIINL